MRISEQGIDIHNTRVNVYSGRRTFKAWTFAGHGDQFIGMDKGLGDNAEYQRVMRLTSDVLGYDAEQKMKQGPLDDLRRTGTAQPLIVANQIGHLKVLEQDHPEVFRGNPDALAGLSLGGVTSLWKAGFFNSEADPEGIATAITYARDRGALFQNHFDNQEKKGQKSCLLVVDIKGGGKASSEVTRNFRTLVSALTSPEFEFGMETAIQMSPTQVLVAGTVDQAGEARAFAKHFNRQGIRAGIAPDSSGAFHSTHCTELKPGYEVLLQDALKQEQGNIPVATSAHVNNDPVDFTTDREAIIRDRVHSVDHTVDWKGVLDEIKRHTQESKVNVYDVGGKGNIARALSSSSPAWKVAAFGAGAALAWGVSHRRRGKC